MTRTNLSLDVDRLWADIMALAEITDPARPWTRRSFTALFLEGRAWLTKRFAEAGLATRIDTSGNLIGRLEGLNPALGVIAIVGTLASIANAFSILRDPARSWWAKVSSVSIALACVAGVWFTLSLHLITLRIAY